MKAMSFKRGVDPKKSLEIGNVAYYKNMWMTQMREHYNSINPWAGEHGITSYDYGQLDCETGRYNFKIINIEKQTEEILFSVPLPELIESLRNRKNRIDRMTETKISYGKQKKSVGKICNS